MKGGNYHPQVERVAIFIDGSNFYHSVKDNFHVHDNIDMGFEGFKKVIEFLRSGRILIGIFYYNASLDRNYNEEIYWKQQKFFADLRKIPGLKIVLCRLRKIINNSGELKYTVKGDDIHIAVDMVSMAYENAYDTAIIVSGDGDFVPAVKTIQKLGKKVENAYFYSTRSDYLRQVCDISVPLDKIVDEYLKEKIKKNPASLKDKP
ncbi:MAG: NYN domain-containing protein [Candidatus Aenigmarchaeota archaeon]|nr:NYN domain-containing protein [Candidatus Aenigmarchaeota archaeon]